MTQETMTYRERAAVEAYSRAKSIGAPAYDAWLAAMCAYGDDNLAARLRVSEILAPST